jgi:hypothetical protein
MSENTQHGSSAAGRARVLWVVVAGGLAYGVINTITQVIDLFSG